MWIEQQHVRRRKRIDTQHGLQNRKHARCRPGLRPVRFGVKRRKRMFGVPRMPAITFRKPVVIEQSAGLENGTCDCMEFLDEPKEHMPMAKLPCSTGQTEPR